MVSLCGEVKEEDMVRMSPIFPVLLMGVLQGQTRKYGQMVLLEVEHG